MKYNTLKFIVGLFVITLFVLFFTFIFFLVKEKGVFEKRHTYHFQANSAEYIYVGMPLKFSGFNMGTIDNISLKDDGAVDILFSVRQTNRKWISQGSVLMISKPLLGAAYVELFTSLGTPVLEDGASLSVISNDSINDLITGLQPIITKATNVLDNVNKITTYMASDNSELMQILKNTNTFSAKLANDNSLEKVSLILQDIKQITNDINKITGSLGRTIITPASSSLQELEAITKDIKHKLDRLDGTVNAIGSYDTDLVELKTQISVGIVKSNQILDKVDSLMSDKNDAEVVLP